MNSDLDEGRTMPDWDIVPGHTVKRRELHARYGGSRFGGIEPSAKTPNVFLFTKPSAGHRFGYAYDGWHPDRTFHYTGDGQVGDQTFRAGGNRAVRDHVEQGRALRLFASTGNTTTYLGRFQVAPDVPYLTADAPDRNADLRSVIVFCLIPIGEVLRRDSEIARGADGSSGLVPVESLDAIEYDVPGAESGSARRREAELVHRYVTWIEGQGHAAVRNRVVLPGGLRAMFTDIFDRTAAELIEAKASAARDQVRMALGQVLDYARFVNHQSKAVLLPVRPPSELVDLLAAHGVACIWERDAGGFERFDLS